MRKIIKGAKLPEKLTQADCKTDRQALIVDRKSRSKTVKIKNKWYRGNGKKGSTLHALNKLYKKKCAYCEEKRTKLDIEHYRPKDSVSEQKSHPGYYWLSYEWQNLILACKDCNRDWKRTKFPVKKSHLSDAKLPPQNRTKKYYDLEELKKYEVPYLINPEENGYDPLDYYEFTKKGKPKGIDKQKRGKKTIKICKLDRKDVNKRRQIILDTLVKNFRISLLTLKTDLSNRAEVVASLELGMTDLKHEKEKVEHHTFHVFINANFNSMVLSEFDPKFHSLITEAYNNTF